MQKGIRCSRSRSSRLAERWSSGIASPRAESQDSLVVTFPEALDRALLARMITVRDSAGDAIEGEIVVSDRETRWVFAPRNAWRRKPYALHVDTELEDL